MIFHHQTCTKGILKSSDKREMILGGNMEMHGEMKSTRKGKYVININIVCTKQKKCL